MSAYRDKVKKYRRRSKQEMKWNAELRERANRIHELERLLNEVRHPLEMEISKLRLDNERLAQDHAELEERRQGESARLSDAELFALAAVVNSEHATITPARRRLVRELQLRGVISSE